MLSVPAVNKGGELLLPVTHTLKPVSHGIVQTCPSLKMFFLLTLIRIRFACVGSCLIAVQCLRTSRNTAESSSIFVRRGLSVSSRKTFGF